MSTDLIKHTPISTVIINDVEIPVEVATDPVTGLSGRDELATGTGMFFDLDGHPVITMRGMKFSLDVIWISEDKKVVDISRNTLISVLGNDTLYSPEKPARYALEINAGEAQKLGIKVDDEVEINLLPNSDLTRLLVLEEVLDYLAKAIPGEKLEYLKPGEKAPRGIQVQRGARGGRGYYPSEVTAVEEETAVLEPTEEREIDVVQAPADPALEVLGDFGDPHNYAVLARETGIRKPATPKQVAKIFENVQFSVVPERGTETMTERNARLDAIEVGDVDQLQNALEDTKEEYGSLGGHDTYFGQRHEGESLLRVLNYIFDSNSVHDELSTDNIAGEVKTIGSVRFPFPKSERHIPKAHASLIKYIVYDAHMNSPVTIGAGIETKPEIHAYANAMFDQIGLSTEILTDIRDAYSDVALDSKAWLDTSEVRQRVSKTLIHELGHLVHFSEYGSKAKNANAKEFIKQAFDNATKSNTGFVSNYSRRNDHEFYAESYSAYIVNTEHLRSVNPDMFYYFEETFNNRPIPYVGWEKRKNKVDYPWFNKDVLTKKAIRDTKEVGDPFDTTMTPLDDDFIMTDSLKKSSDDDLSKLLALSTGLEYLSKQEPGKREYLAPGEEAPEGVRVERGQRGGRYYTPGVASSAVDRALADIETPEEEREIDVVTPAEPEEQIAPSEQPDMLTPNGVNEYFDTIATNLEEQLIKIAGEGHKPFLGKEISPFNLTADNITTAGYTDGSEKGDKYPSGLGINSYENFTVTLASGFLGRQKKQFIYKMVPGENRGEILAYSIDRVLGLNIVPFVKQHSINMYTLNDTLEKTHGTDIGDNSLQNMRQKGVDERAAGHFQEFCENCVGRDDRAKIMADMLSTEKGREEIFKIMLLDYITGNSDRHNGNYLITEDGKMVAIDNGMIGGMHTAHKEQAPLHLDPNTFGYLSFPYALTDEMDKKFQGIETPTGDDLQNEAAKFFDKYFDKDKLDAVFTIINWKPIPQYGQSETIFKDNFVKRAINNIQEAFSTGWDYDSYDPRTPSYLTPFDFTKNLKQELANEGINIEVIRSLNFDAHDIDEIELEEPNIYEEDEFN